MSGFFLSSYTMKLFYVYILHSPSTNGFYIGQTEDFEKRLEEHNNHKYESSHTSRASDWEEFFVLKCITRRQAILIEKHIKKAKKRKYLEDLKTYPEISQKLLTKYQEM
jgi:putative endonuclease